MSKQKTDNFLKLAYFDEQAAVDFLERLDEGEITEKLTKKSRKVYGCGWRRKCWEKFF
ncbi:hypothetical protein [Aerococcus urinaeequi]|jgi:hypothetical protein|uniref:hypothetical protein n=1 Tax=Aerococcus urinaeequi TaxID=51665 RepID=UPI003D6AA975